MELRHSPADARKQRPQPALPTVRVPSDKKRLRMPSIHARFCGPVASSSAVWFMRPLSTRSGLRHPQWLLVLRKIGLNHTCLLSLFMLSFALHFCLSFQVKRMWTTKACASPCLAQAHTPRNNSASTKPRWRRCCGHCSSAAVEVRHTPVLGSLLAGQPAPRDRPFRHCEPLKWIITCLVVSFNVSVFSAHDSGIVDSHLQKDFPFASFSLQTFALRHLVDDYELGEVSVSLLTVQHRCAFRLVYSRTLLLKLEQTVVKLVFVERLQNEINTPPD